MRQCLECSEKIVGREDKKFCSDGCRNAHNNRINRDSNNIMRTINNKLRKNYRILGDMKPEEKVKISRSKLLNKGFDFEFFTNIFRTKTGSTYYFIYDYGYLELENDVFILVRNRNLINYS